MAAPRRDRSRGLQIRARPDAGRIRAGRRSRTHQEVGQRSRGAAAPLRGALHALMQPTQVESDEVISGCIVATNGVGYVLRVTKELAARTGQTVSILQFARAELFRNEFQRPI